VKVEGDAFGFVMDELEDYDLSGVGKGERGTAIIRDTEVRTQNRLHLLHRLTEHWAAKTFQHITSQFHLQAF